MGSSIGMRAVSTWTTIKSATMAATHITTAVVPSSCGASASAKLRAPECRHSAPATRNSTGSSSVANVASRDAPMPSKRAARVERAEHQRHPPEAPDVGEPHEVERERRDRARADERHDAGGRERGDQHDDRPEAEHRRRHLAVDGGLAHEAPEIEGELEDRGASPT